MIITPAIYQAKNGAIELKADVSSDTILASQKQMAQIFEVTPKNITIHLKQIFVDKELEEKATCKDFLQVQKEVKRNIKEYNLDVIIAIGYQVNSVLGTKFRIWATKSFDNFKIEQIVRNYLNISSLRVIFGVAQPELSQENLDNIKIPNILFNNDCQL
ncbi:Virulence protein [uncultured Gammaproteobacteria bacterium]|jgi:hypothetical protein|nr:Uncharacterized protein clustered with Type I restriction-modification system [uncultured Gammaproteobacteria bacterium]CAC9477516.1 Uncharacterized protein clustered with Type I restriction-modification system [uncultured Gammaproteobacteria bacterium]VVH65799.1 Virulence protein [uncultured Gammaproteobacteria bacterium]